MEIVFFLQTFFEGLIPLWISILLYINNLRLFLILLLYFCVNIKITNTNRVNRRIRSDYFSSIDSPEKAYWLGLLFTDGSVDHYGHTGRIRLQLQEQDIDILEKFKEDL